MVRITPENEPVLAHFGVAVVTAQNLERIVGRLVALVEPPNPKAVDDSLAARIADVDHAVLGRLEKRLRAAGYKALADTAVEAVRALRNSLVHRFFWTDNRSAKLNTAEGRAELVAELDGITEELDRAAAHVRTALIGAGLDRTHGASAVIRRLREHLRGVATGPLAASAGKLIRASPEATRRAIAQIAEEEQRRAAEADEAAGTP